MKLLFLGVSAAYCLNDGSFQSNMLLESSSGQKLLIDCGSDARRSLHAQGFNHSDIHAVYISHLHSDHTGGLEWLGFSRRFIDGKKSALFISPDQVEQLWQNVLRGGMSSVEDEEATLSSFFDLIPIENNSFIWENYQFKLIKTNHMISNGKIMPSYGLLISSKTENIFITTDTRFSPELNTVYEQATLIFQDCETSSRSSNQHARYDDLRNLSPDLKKKMWLYDYNEGELPNAQQDGFLGFVVRGQHFVF
ncbi:ribonuclease Z [Legionella massiliensis]|uniref:Ribonuclease Z n=1 Tax=Legionella massiliensis TaxID=1034943 RepID=A0A078L1I5_9GAMM|nr:MBL fold metallo-hydrolase [Legionella massiliensis]CDZ79112.1 ribonuclease Z [Legionella massiliensis]CEE14850.1 Ribonuclease BN [Legionella massiliensis]